MIRTLQIPPERWELALESLAHYIGERPIRVEVMGRALGDQEMAQLLPFRGVTFEARGSERGSLTVMAGSDVEPLEHRIADPIAVYLALNDAGEMTWLAFEEAGELGIARTLIHFEPLPALPPEVEEQWPQPA
jgi:hypothetical protein